MLKAFTAAVAEYGWWDAIAYASGRVIARLSKGRLRLIKYYFVAQPVPRAPLLPPGRGAKIEIREIAATDPVLAQMPRPAVVIRARFEQGAFCLGAFLDGSLIGFIWLLLGAYREDEVRACFEPLPLRKAAWDFDVYVDFQKRMSFALPRLWDSANERLRQNGIDWSISRISAFNRASLSTHARLGAKVLGGAIFLRGRHWQAMVGNVAPYCHFSRNDDDFPVISLSPITQ